VSSFPFCLPQYFSFFPFVLCLTHCTVTANTFSLLQFKLRFVISIEIYNSFIWDHFANCWGSQANAPCAPHLYLGWDDMTCKWNWQACGIPDFEFSNWLRLWQLLQIQYTDFIISAHKILKQWIPTEEKLYERIAEFEYSLRISRTPCTVVCGVKFQVFHFQRCTLYGDARYACITTESISSICWNIGDFYLYCFRSQACRYC